MDNRLPSGGHFVASLLFFSLTAIIAIVLLLAAGVVWLSVVTGSFILSALIVGVFFAVLTTAIYLLSIREAVEHIRTQAQTVYEVARAAQSGYEWVLQKVRLFTALRERHREE